MTNREPKRSTSSWPAGSSVPAVNSGSAGRRFSPVNYEFPPRSLGLAEHRPVVVLSAGSENAAREGLAITRAAQLVLLNFRLLLSSRTTAASGSCEHSLNRNLGSFCQ